MTKVSVAWFDQVKGIGEGISEDGEKVFLSHLAIKDRENQFKGLLPREELVCELSRNHEGTIALSIVKS